MTLHRRLAASLLLALAAAGVTATEARAEWTACNKSSYVLNTAIAFPEGGDLITEGWIRIRPNECAIVRAQRLNPGMHYFYAIASRAHRGGRREWTEDMPLCVQPDRNFSITGMGDCEEAGFETRLFVPLNVTQGVHRMDVEEPENYSSQRAGAAGLQRLLRDNGYAIEDIDGYLGPRTVRAINAFLSDQGLSSQPPAHELIDMLEQKALASADRTGLHLCNQAEARVWTAIAVRREEAWESRGWWALGPQDCAKVLDEAPEGQDSYYVYASLEEGQRERPLVAAQEEFCLAETKFAILGRVNCAARGYRAGPFVSVPISSEGAVVLNFQEADFDPLAQAAARRQ